MYNSLRAILMCIILSTNFTLFAANKLPLLQRVVNRLDTFAGCGPARVTCLKDSRFKHIEGYAFSTKGESVKIVKPNGETIDIDKPVAGVNEKNLPKESEFEEKFYSSLPGGGAGTDFGYSLGKQNQWNSANYIWDAKRGELKFARYNQTFVNSEKKESSYEYLLLRNDKDNIFKFSVSEKTKISDGTAVIESSLRFRIGKNEALRSIKRVKLNENGTGRLEISIHNFDDNSDTVRAITLPKSNSSNAMPSASLQPTEGVS